MRRGAAVLALALTTLCACGGSVAVTPALLRRPTIATQAPPTQPNVSLAARNLDLNSVAQRHVRRADFAFDATTDAPAASWLVVHDPASDSFARYRLDERDGTAADFLGLTAAGTAALIGYSEGNGPSRRIGLLLLATGSVRWFDSDPQTYGAGVLSAAAPDGRTIATVDVVFDPSDPTGQTEDRSRVAVGLIDVASGTYRRIWLSDGVAGWSAESWVAWSPDGQLLAVTYLSAAGGNDVDTSMVIDRTGRVLRTFEPDTSVVPQTNAAWVANTYLGVLGPTSYEVFEVRSGAVFGVRANGAIGRVGQWYVSASRVQGKPSQLVVTNTSGALSHAWITFAQQVTVHRVDFA
jgi:hypothetical protein